MLLQKILLLPDCWNKTLTRWIAISSANCVEQPSKPSIKKNKLSKRKESVSNEIRDHLSEVNLEHFVKNLPSKLLRRNSAQKVVLYLVNQYTAKTLAEIISEELLKDKTSCFIECNPGLGLLTEELIKIGIPKINVFEKNETFTAKDSPLRKLMSTYPNQVFLRKLNFHDLWLKSLWDQHYKESTAETYLADVPCCKWEEKPFAQIVTACPNKMFLSLYLNNFIHDTIVFEHGRPTLYIILPSYIWKRHSEDRKSIKNLRYYSPQNLMITLFFNTKVLGEVSRKSFVPWPKEKEKKIDEMTNPMFVIKMEPKVECYQAIDKDDMKSFWFFLKFCLRSKKLKVIMELEKLINGCGMRLLGDDIDICTTFKELDPQRLLQLFKTFRSWPEYDENLFFPSSLSTEESKKDEEEKFQVEEEEKDGEENATDASSHLLSNRIQANE